MIEVTNTYDLKTGIDLELYAKWAKEAAATIVRQPGFVELRANRNMLGSPLIRTSTCWASISDWARFAEGPWVEMEHELRTFATNLKVEMWTASPVLPAPLHPADDNQTGLLGM